MSRPDLLSQLPSIDELLEHPKVRAAVDRWNRSSAAGRLRSAVATVGAEVSRQAEGLGRLAPGELVERLVRQLDPPASSTPSAVVNATGDLFAASWIGAALPPVAIAAGTAAAEGARRDCGRAGPIAATLIGTDLAISLSSHALALQATLEALAAGGACVIARGDMAELRNGVRLDDLCRRAGVMLHEVGASNAATVDDYRTVLGELGGGPKVLLRRSQFPGVGVAELSAAARSVNAHLVVDAGPARPRGDSPSYAEPSPSAEAAASAGADLIVMDGAGLVGGPVSGVVAGRRPMVEGVAHHGAAMVAAIDPVAEAALAATLELFLQPAQLRFVHPLYQLLDTPTENLRTRAERVAARLEAIDHIGSAAASVSRSACGFATGAETWIVRFQHARESLERTVQRLTESDPAIFARHDHEGVVLDLRTVAPRDDVQLVAAMLPTSGAGEAG